MAKIIGVKFKNTAKTYYFAPANDTDVYEERSGVVVETAKGVEYGTVVFGMKEVPESEIVHPLKPILRKATESDEKAVKDDVVAAKAAENISLKVNLLYGDDKYSGSWTLNIVGYAEKVMAGEYSAITDALMLDMVNYIKQTYVYFASVGLVSTDVLAAAESRINAILGSDYDSGASFDGTAVNNSTNGGLLDAKLELGAEIAFVFTPKNASDADKYVFTQNGAVLDSKVVSDGAKTFIVVKTYVYRVGETISYRAEVDENTVYEGSYNLKSYYDYLVSRNETDASLAVLALYKYSVSAKAYRDEIVGND